MTVMTDYFSCRKNWTKLMCVPVLFSLLTPLASLTSVPCICSLNSFSHYNHTLPSGSFCQCTICKSPPTGNPTSQGTIS